MRSPARWAHDTCTCACACVSLSPACLRLDRSRPRFDPLQSACARRRVQHHVKSISFQSPRLLVLSPCSIQVYQTDRTETLSHSAQQPTLLYHCQGREDPKKSCYMVLRAMEPWPPESQRHPHQLYVCTLFSPSTIHNRLIVPKCRRTVPFHVRSAGI